MEKDFIAVGETLSVDDKVSLVFLLCNDPKTSIHVIRSLTASESTEEENGFFRQFLLQHLLLQPCARESFIEGLTIIQNYRAGCLLGLSKQEMFGQNILGNISKIKKDLYLLADSINASQTCDLIYRISGEVKECRYLEEVLLNWQVKEETDFRSSSMEKLRNYLKDSDKDKNNVFSDILYGNDEFYPLIDPKELGYCIVINNSTFTRSSEFQELTPSEELTPRPGSERDVESIQEVFQLLHFNVKTHNNVLYSDLRELLTMYATSVPFSHSCIVLIVMSHGTEDVVYTADSVPIHVEALEMAFQRNLCPQLTGKPKILIIQACQGRHLQRVMMDGISKRNESAGFSTVVGPERADALTLWSTVKGYASFRDRIEGSWFIQQLCRELQENASTKDLVDIVTRVNKKLRKQNFHGVVMVPALTSTLCKKIMLVKK